MREPQAGCLGFLNDALLIHRSWRTGISINFLSLVLAFAIAFGVCYITTPAVKRLAVKVGAWDRPSPRREAILKPRLGGIALYLAFVASVLVTSPLVQGRTLEEWQKIIGILFGAAVVVVVGAIDDRFELPPISQLLAQTIAAVITIASGIIIKEIPNPFGTTLVNSTVSLSEPVAIAFTLFWIVGAMNAINFIDAVDGLAGGIGAIAGMVLFIHSFQLTQYSIALLPLALAGVAIGFLPHNFSPAKITLGTSGSLFLGYALGSLSVIGGTKAATILLVLGIPIIDAAWIIVRRIAKRQSPFRGDRTHLHHRLIGMGLSHNQVMLLYYGACFLFGGLALLLSSRLLKFYVLLGIAALVAGMLAIMAQRNWNKGG